MGYVAIKGGGLAIKGAEDTLDYLRCEQGDSGTPLDMDPSNINYVFCMVACCQKAAYIILNSPH